MAIAQDGMTRSSAAFLPLDADRKRRLIVAIANSVISHVDELTTLDAAIGDGDHGHNMKRGFDAARLLDLIETERITVTFALPMMYRALLEELERRRRDVASLRLAVYAMAPMPTHELKNAIATLGCEFSLMFGQTEMNPTATYFRPEHQLSHPGAVGTPSPNAEVAGVMSPSPAP